MPHSEATKAKLRGRRLSEEQKAAISVANTGRKPTKETCAKLSKVWLGRNHTPETCDKLSALKTGIPLTEAHKAALRGKRGKLENVRLAKLGDKNPNFGKPRSEETKKKIQEANIKTWYTKHKSLSS